MEIHLFVVRWWAVLIGVVVSMIVGMVWYGPLFGKHWMKAAGLTEKDVSEGMNAGLLIGSIGTSIITVYVLGVVQNVVAVKTLGGALLTAILVWLAFMAAPTWNHYAYQGKPKTLFTTTVFYDLTVYLIVSIVLFYTH